MSKVRRTTAAVAMAAIVVLVAGAVVALASSAHFKKGGEPACTIAGSATSKTVQCTGTLAGLGGGDLSIPTTVSGSAVYQCQNGGGNIAPGQNRVLVGPSTVPTNVPGSSVKNGEVTFTTQPNTLTASTTVSGSQAGCPNGNWTGVNPTLTVTDITLKISQDSTLLFTCTASNAAGLTSPVRLTC